MELVKLLKTRIAYEKFQRNATYSFHERIIFWWNRGGKKKSWNRWRSNKHLPVQSKNRNTRKRGEIFSDLTIKTPERFTNIVMVYLLLALYFKPFYSVSIVNFRYVFVWWCIKLFRAISNNWLTSSILFLVQSSNLFN